MLIFIHWNDEAFLTVDGIRMDLFRLFRFYTENDIISFDCRDIIIRIIDRDGAGFFQLMLQAFHLFYQF